MQHTANSKTQLITKLPFKELAQRMKEGSLTSVELTQFCLDRIAKDNSKLHAFVEIFTKTALKDAAERDAERASGKFCGPLHGIPIAIKDLIDVRGSITSFGSRNYSHCPATQNATCIQNLVDAGMVILGKVHMVEFALGSWGTNQSMGSPINPHDTHVQRVSGGSSSGSAVAVASGMVPCALGSDTGGSIRIPSSLCGIVGLKTTTGLVDKAGVAPLSQTLDTLGPMTNSVDDARLLLEIMTNRSYPLHEPPLDTIKAGLVSACQLEPLDPEVEDALTEIITKLSSAGMKTETLHLPLPPPDYQHLNGTIMNFEGFANVGHLAEDYTKPMDPFVRTRILSGRNITKDAYYDAITERMTAIQSFRDHIKDLDIILLPTTPLPASPIAEVDESFMPMSRFTRWGNYLDLCGISVPIGHTHQGLPIGLQILSKGGDETKIIGFAASVEAIQKG